MTLQLCTQSGQSSMRQTHSPSLRLQVEEPLYFVDFLREPVVDNDTGEIINAHPSYYEAVPGGLPDVRKRVEALQVRLLLHRPALCCTALHCWQTQVAGIQRVCVTTRLSTAVRQDAASDRCWQQSAKPPARMCAACMHPEQHIRLPKRRAHLPSATAQVAD